VVAVAALVLAEAGFQLVALLATALASTLALEQRFVLQEINSVVSSPAMYCNVMLSCPQFILNVFPMIYRNRLLQPIVVHL
jgi:hypothetical protein